jgi:hypothetical protein
MLHLIVFVLYISHSCFTTGQQTTTPLTRKILLSVSQFCYFTYYKSECIQSALELNKLAFALLMF